MMPDKTAKPSPFHFPEPDEEQFLEKMERLEGRLDDLEQQVLQTLAEVEIPNSWLEEWEAFTETNPDPGEEQAREWVESHLNRLKGFTELDRLEQKEIASLYQDILYFTKDVLNRKEEVQGFLAQEEGEWMDHINTSIP